MLVVLGSACSATDETSSIDGPLEAPVGLDASSIEGSAGAAANDADAEATTQTDGGSDFLSSLDRTPLWDPFEGAGPFSTAGGAESATAPITTGAAGGTDLPESVQRVIGAFATDWTRRSADLSSLRVGLEADDPRDLIPPVDEPKFETVVQGGYWLLPDEPGALVEIDGDARFYPLAILTRHEIVNDRFGDIPVAVTYCPLCNTALAFDRRVDGEVLRLGVSGLLRNSDLVMWDDHSETLWQQITGEALVGELAGTELSLVPTSIVSYQQFAADHPNGRSLAPKTGHAIKYGANPYRFYSSNDAPIARFYDGDIDERVPALERVIGVTGFPSATEDNETTTIAGESNGTQAIAFPFSTVRLAGAVNTDLAGRPIVVWVGGATADGLDAESVAAGRALGTGVAFSSQVGDQVLTFDRFEPKLGAQQEPPVEEFFTDRQTGTRWSVLGTAVEGPLAGTRLEPVLHRNDFWFAWTAFFPDAELYQ